MEPNTEHLTYEQLRDIVTDLAATNIDTLEELNKVAAEKERIEAENVQLRKQATSKETVYLEKVASHGISPLVLAPIVKRLEEAGFVKAGAATAACSDLAKDPMAAVRLLDSIATSFIEDDNFSEGTLSKSASEGINQDKPGQTVYDEDNWSAVIRKR
jgi:hypothetical protein